MNRSATGSRSPGAKMAWVATTAMTAALLSGCTTGTAPSADLSASKAESALASGRAVKAIAHAEAAVLAEPHNAAYRAMLGAAYLDAGRFGSAATSFEDAMQLGDNSPRTALSLALARTGEGRDRDAAALLDDWQGEISAADLGLALALAGEPDRGIHLMATAIRNGENTAKIRQNLAYAYSLAGQWREARIMVAQDVPADKVADRIEQWARLAHPDAGQYRVAALLGVPAGVADSGQPAQLALTNNPTLEQLAAEASASITPEAEPAPAPATAAEELPPIASIDPTVELARYEAPEADQFHDAFRAPPAPVRQDAASFAQAAPQEARPAPQSPARVAAPAPAAAPVTESTHLVQLGSFASEQGARRAWGIYVKKYPELAGHKMVITQAVVRGKNYWRVSAAGFGKGSSAAMCGKVRGSGEGCFAYAQGKPLPGALDNGVRLAQR